MKQKILFIMTGSISCYKACEAIAKLRNKYTVQVVMTKAATQFVGPMTLEALTGLPVLTETFEQGKALHHISEVRNADLIMVAPATANFVGKMAQGICDDLASTMIAAHDFKKPIIVAPAMNTFMWENPANKENVEKLKKRGFFILEPAEGILACGEEGKGKLVSPDLIADSVVHYLRPFMNKKILISSGGTQELIDDVRVLTNKSSGRTGAVIADYLHSQGYDVLYVGSKNGAKPKNSYINQVTFQTFKNLQEILKTSLSKEYFDVVIHSAAVSDFSVQPTEGKLSSDITPKLNFTKNEKIIDSIKKWSKNKNVEVVGFKLTAKSSPLEQSNAVRKLFDHADIDYVVLNDISQINIEKHPSKIFSNKMKRLTMESSGSTKLELAQNIGSLFKEK